MLRPVAVVVGLIAALSLGVLAAGWFYHNVINVDVDGRPLVEWRAAKIHGKKDPRLRNRYGTADQAASHEGCDTVAIP